MTYATCPPQHIGAYRAFLPLACCRTLLVTVRSSDSLTGGGRQRESEESEPWLLHPSQSHQCVLAGREV